MNKTEILLTDIMRSRIYETDVDRNPWFLLEKLKKDLRAAHTNRYGSLFEHCPPSRSFGCSGSCQSCWDQDVEKFKRKGEAPCL